MAPPLCLQASAAKNTPPIFIFPVLSSPSTSLRSAVCCASTVDDISCHRPGDCSVSPTFYYMVQRSYLSCFCEQ